MATKTRKKYTPETKKHYVNMFIVEHKKTNLTQKEFAKKYSLSQNTFKKWLRSNEQYKSNRTRLTPLAEIEYFLDLFLQERKKTNITQRDFAKAHNIKKYTFNNWVRRNPHIITSTQETRKDNGINHIRMELYQQLKVEYVLLTNKIVTVREYIKIAENKNSTSKDIETIRAHA